MRLAEYLGRVRAVDTAPDLVLICTGVTQALGLAVKPLVAAGIRCVAIEDPAQPDVYRIVAAAGATAVPVCVDEHGVVVRALANTRARAVIVTPAHQFPRGGILSAERRQELVAWAHTCGGFIVEDDYDAEYRYDGPPVGAMQGPREESCFIRCPATGGSAGGPFSTGSCWVTGNSRSGKSKKGCAAH